VAGAAGPCVALDNFHQPLDAVTFGFAADAHVRALAVAYPRHEAASCQHVLDHVMHHVVRDDPLLGTVDALYRTAGAHDFHAVEFAGTFGEDELHARNISSRRGGFEIRLRRSCSGRLSLRLSQPARAQLSVLRREATTTGCFLFRGWRVARRVATWRARCAVVRLPRRTSAASATRIGGVCSPLKQSSSRRAIRLSRLAAVRLPTTTANRRWPSRTAVEARLKPEASVKPVFRPSMPG